MINKLAKRHRVAREILETELKYVSDLKLVVELFLRPLREEKKNLIKESEVRAIFGNIEEVRARVCVCVCVARARLADERRPHSSSAST
jgi:hypothetical protein